MNTVYDTRNANTRAQIYKGALMPDGRDGRYACQY